MNRHLVFSALLAATLAWYPPIIHADEKKVESFVYDEEVYRAEFKLQRNMSSFNRTIGILGDLLREQRRLFSEKNTGGASETADKAEEAMNEASLLGAQKQYDGAYAQLDLAFGLLTTSIKKMLATPGK
jgi:hypothetical protein